MTMCGGGGHMITCLYKVPQNRYQHNVGYGGHDVGLSMSDAAVALRITSLERPALGVV